MNRYFIWNAALAIFCAANLYRILGHSYVPGWAQGLCGAATLVVVAIAAMSWGTGPFSGS
jgi:hypothetical protein